MTIDALIGKSILQAFGNSYYLIGLMGIFVFGVFCAVLRLPALVSILAVGLMALLLFAPAATETLNLGGIGVDTSSYYVWFIVMLVVGVILYMALKVTVWREY